MQLKKENIFKKNNKGLNEVGKYGNKRSGSITIEALYLVIWRG